MNKVKKERKYKSTPSKSTGRKFLDKQKLERQQKINKLRGVTKTIMLNFCFLGGVPKHGGQIETKWCTFLQNIPKKYNYRLITHPAKYEDENTRKSKLQQNGLKKIPRKYWTPTKWATKSLVLGTLKMFSYAYSLNTKRGVNNYHNYYILVDSTCYPITKDTKDIEERMKLLFNGNENISVGDQWISITEKFLQSILNSCFTCFKKYKFMDKDYWPDYIEWNNGKLIYDVNRCFERNEFNDMCKKTHNFIKMFLNIEYDEFRDYIRGNNQGASKTIIDFENVLDTVTGTEIKITGGGGAWDENFFMILSIIWKRVRNTMSPTQIRNTKNGISKLICNNDYRFTNRIFANPHFNTPYHSFKGSNGDELKLLDFSKQYVDGKPKIMSHVFTNWSVFSNSSSNMLRFDPKMKNFNQIIINYFNEVKINDGKKDPQDLYLEFIYKIYKTKEQKQPFYHPIEIYCNQTLAKDARSKHCYDEHGKYDDCLESLQVANNDTLKNLQRMYNNNKKYDYDDFVDKMIETVKRIFNGNNELWEFQHWVRAYLYMFEPNNKPPNLHDDSVLLGIAQQFKHCLFTRKIIDH